METQGQILEGSTFGNWLETIITIYRPKTIVEIGTWKGLGSTKRIIDSIAKNNLDAEFYSLEANKGFHEIATANLSAVLSDKVHLLYGRIIEVREIHDFVQRNEISAVQSGWLQNDLMDFARCENVLAQLPESIDFLLLDGGEFSTYAEWSKLKDRTKVVALDDTVELKNREIRQQLLDDPSYELITDSQERNGFSIFRLASRPV